MSYEAHQHLLEDCQKANAIIALNAFFDDLLRYDEMQFFFVGGIIRDMLFHRETTDIDLVFVGNFDDLASSLNEKYHVQCSNLLTLQVRIGMYHVDIVRARKERYPNNDGSPLVTPCSIEEDMIRRDFTLNTAYMVLNESHKNTVIDYMREQKLAGIEITYAHPNFLKDLNNQTLSVLHDLSFKEDPTRLMRLIKYQLTLNLTCDHRTQQLKKEALQQHYIRSLTEARFMRTLKKLIVEKQWYEMVERLVLGGFLEDYYKQKFAFNHSIDKIHVLEEPLSTAERLVFRLFILYDVNYGYLAPFYPNAVSDYGLLDKVVRLDCFGQEEATIETMLRGHVDDPKQSVALWQFSVYRRKVQKSVFSAYLMSRIAKPPDREALLHWIGCENTLPAPVLTGHDLMAMGIYGKEIAVYQGFLAALNISRRYHQQPLVSKEEARHLIENKPIE